ncbi:MAG: hypothetical protein HN736_16130 [Anaerolineae bacterium]|nr:hypothetical protein [Anaerolineae bacterium]MBT4312610.1 hypothetical protein [Anaerolineae bacterium]MBT4456716.1 hypothetical protein [Anaerolineae bacterium]MBT4841536.1 hypothetical protein [Anaerolineae bacterium]MBT6060904.1 hypothetical protein [Anaerolineae bacterium]
MSEKNKSQENFDNVLEALREKAQDNVEETSASQNKLVTPKEMKRKTPLWVMRGLMAFLTLIVVAEGFILIKNREQIELLKYANGPPIESYAEPVDDPLPTPTEIVLIPPEPSLEPPPDELLLEPPEPAPIPLPEGVDEIPFPEDD